MSAVNLKDDAFAAVREKYGFVPNLIREMSKSPAAARVYLDGQEAMAGASLGSREQQAVQLAVSAYNRCDYCQAAHRAGGRTAGIPASDLDAIQKNSLPRDARLRSLVSATHLLLLRRGFLSAADLTALEAEGIDRGQVYEIVALIGLKTISNYVNHIAHTEIDEAFRS